MSEKNSTDSPETFIKGLELSARFFDEAIKPIIASELPELRYAAALIGEGSEVLGYDTEMSADHDWGPRAKIFLRDSDVEKFAETIRRTLSEKLPRSFCNYPTNFSQTSGDKTKWIDYVGDGPINHRVEFSSLREFFLDYLSLDLEKEIEAADWLTLSEQKLATVAGGRIFHDEIGLTEICDRFTYYPHEIWLYRLASGWARIEQEEHLMGRAGSVGDEIGSAIIASRLVRDLMRLCFMIEKKYAPYAKWFGTAFKHLKCAPALEPIFLSALRSHNWQERQEHLAQAYSYIAVMHLDLRITQELSVKPRMFFGRPFLVISMGDYSRAIAELITDPEIQSIADRGLIGSVDQFSDSTDLISHPYWREYLKSFFSKPERPR